MISLRSCLPAAVAVALSLPMAGICGSDEGDTGYRQARPQAWLDTGDESTPPATSPRFAAATSSSGRVLWFVPSDHDASTTCLSFMNAAPAQQSVQLDGFTLAGAAAGTWLIDVPARSYVRACSDSIVASPPPSWSALVVVNFTDFSNYVRATLPPGVQIDGFVVVTGAGVYDPRVSFTAMMPLQFNTDVPRATVVQFTPQDSDGNATCLFFYNTSAVAATAQVRGYSGGALSGLWNVDLAAGAMVRACTDSLAASPPPSWAAMQLLNFTDFTQRAEISLPPFVKVEGYVLWNAATGTVDPRATDSNYLRLRVESNPEYDNIFADGFD